MPELRYRCVQDSRSDIACSNVAAAAWEDVHGRAAGQGRPGGGGRMGGSYLGSTSRGAWRIVWPSSAAPPKAPVRQICMKSACRLSASAGASPDARCAHTAATGSSNTRMRTITAPLLPNPILPVRTSESCSRSTQHVSIASAAVDGVPPSYVRARMHGREEASRVTRCGGDHTHAWTGSTVTAVTAVTAETARDGRFGGRVRGVRVQNDGVVCAGPAKQTWR